MLGADVVVVGGGIAWSAAALAAARKGAEVVILTKLPDPEEANTRYAQGGIIYTGPNDSPGFLSGTSSGRVRADEPLQSCSRGRVRRSCASS